MSTSPKKAKYTDLKIDRDLLDPRFEGYKLSLDQLPVQDGKLPSGVQWVLPSTDQWSFQHIRLFSGHNHLHINPWTITEKFRHLYVVLSDGIYYIALEQGKFVWPELRKTLDLKLDNFADRKDKFNVSITFPTSDHAIVSDGCGDLIFCSISGDANGERWEILHRAANICDGKAFVILDSRFRPMAPEMDVHVLLHYVTELEQRPESKDDALFANTIEWITFKKGERFEEARRRRLLSKGNLDYAALGIDCNSLCTLTSEPIRFIYDSQNPVIETESEEAKLDVPKRYSWGQTAEDLCVVFSVDQQMTKNDIAWRLSSETIHIALDRQPDPDILLEGEFHLPVDVEGSTWTLESGRLEITLRKRDVGRMWTEVVSGDQRGEYVPDPELMKEVSERLKHFTSETEVSTVNSKIAFNAQQLEECDAVSNDANHLQWLDGETHSTVMEADIGGHQWLFNVRFRGDHLPYICFRHDVDGILWHVPDGPSNDDDQNRTWTHRYTFNAFGYVQAGKRDRKFCTCSTNGSYATVVDCQRHAYIYWQPTAVDTDLRNRKTGQRISKVAKQQLISISGFDQGDQRHSDDILGVVAFDDILLLLTEDRLIAAYVK